MSQNSKYGKVGRTDRQKYFLICIITYTLRWQENTHKKSYSKKNWYWDWYETYLFLATFDKSLVGFLFLGIFLATSDNSFFSLLFLGFFLATSKYSFVNFLFLEFFLVKSDNLFVSFLFNKTWSTSAFYFIV